MATLRAGWGTVWRHQLRWAITIRVCQQLPYFLSILANGTAWPLLWILLDRSPRTLAAGTALLGLRIVQGLALEARFTGRRPRGTDLGLAPLKDLLQVALWATAFLRHEVVWRGVRYRVRRDGRLQPPQS